MNLSITEEKEKSTGDKEGKSVFYIRETPYDPGRSYQATVITREAAEWIKNGSWGSIKID